MTFSVLEGELLVMQRTTSTTKVPKNSCMILDLMVEVMSSLSWLRRRCRNPETSASKESVTEVTTVKVTDEVISEVATVVTHVTPCNDHKILFGICLSHIVSNFDCSKCWGTFWGWSCSSVGGSLEAELPISKGNSVHKLIDRGIISNNRDGV